MIWVFGDFSSSTFAAFEVDVHKWLGKPQTFIAKEAGCSQSAVSQHVNWMLSGRKKCRRKRCTKHRETRSLMRIVKQNRFKNLGELHKELTMQQLTSDHQGEPQSIQLVHSEKVQHILRASPMAAEHKRSKGPWEVSFSEGKSSLSTSDHPGHYLK